MENKNDFSKGLNLDLDQSRLPDNTVIFLKNMTRNVNTNANVPARAGANKDVLTPLEGSTAMTLMGMPVAVNYSIGYYSSDQTNEGYFFVYNSAGNHTIWVIRGDTGVVQKVYEGPLLNFQLDPQYFFSIGRVTLQLRNYVDPITDVTTNFKFLCFTDNFNEPRLISVEDSINTSSFTTPNTYWTGAGSFYIADTLLTLGVPVPMQCIGLNAPNSYTPDPADLTVQNMIVRRVIQFRIKYIYIDGRESPHGIISSQYTPIIGSGCVTASNGLPRCMNINFDSGSPFVNYIQIEYRVWVDGLTPSETEWYLYETIAKYDNSGAVAWYNRSINPDLNYDPVTNYITYTFCADKNSDPIDINETNINETGVPRSSNTIFGVEKRIGAANNKRGFQPIDPEQLKKITFSVQSSTSGCPASPIRQVIIYSSIYVAYAGGGLTGVIGKINNSGPYAWGNRNFNPWPGPWASKFDMEFGDQQNPGFIGYMAGMGGSQYSTVCVQGTLDSSGNFTQGITDLNPVLQYKFNIPAGKYLFRIASHKAKINDADFQQTSTYVVGISPMSDVLLGAGLGSSRNSYAANPIKEIEIDCTCGDVVLNGNSGIYGGTGTDPVLIILDISAPTGNAIDGYLVEQQGGNAPIEMNPIVFGAGNGTGTPVDTFGSFFTDHNGFYFAGAHGLGMNLAIFSDICDGMGSTQRYVITNTNLNIKHGDGTGTATNPSVGGNWKNKMWVSDGVSSQYPETARRRIKQTVTLCDDNTVGLPGIPVIMTKGGSNLTDTNGLSVVVAHNRYTYATSFNAFYAANLPVLSNLIPNYGTSPLNKDSVLLSQKGGCQWTACNGTACGSISADCIPSVPDIIVDYLPCCSSAPDCRVVVLTDINVNASGINLSGIQSGGRYPLGIIGHDGLGRSTFVQKCGYVNANNLNDATYRKFLLQSIGYSIAPSFTLPKVFKYITFAVAKNVLFTDSFMWTVDVVQPVDSTGSTNPSNPTSLRIYYNSLNEYNKNYNFNTQSTWEFIAKDESGNPLDAPIEGDIVQFIANGDGTWFDAVISCPVNYDKNGMFFTIDYINSLANLTNGALFKIIRPNQFLGADTLYFEQCLTIKLDDNGQVPTPFLSGVLPYFDSYLLARLLPVPRLAGSTGVIPVGATTPPSTAQYSSTGQTATGTTQGTYVDNNIANNNSIIIMQTIDDNTSFPFYFESPSPSDFWGNHAGNWGRVFAANPYEAEQLIITEIALSDAIGERGLLNGISYFEDVNVETFDRNTWGAIIAVLVETGILLVICESDHFTTEYNASVLQIDPNTNQIISNNPNGIFAPPRRKSGTSYGCAQSDIGSIQKYTGIAIWVDGSGYLVFHNFSAAVAVQALGGYDGYLKNKIATMKLRNNNPDTYGLTYWVSGFDPKAWEYSLTSFNIPAAGPPEYINELDKVDLTKNETIVIDGENGMLKRMVSYTPEMFGALAGFYLQSNFIMFKNGVPSLLYAGISATPPPYNNFFGVQCKKRIRLVVNNGPDTVKRFLWNEVYCKQHKMIAPSIRTESGQVSRLLEVMWDFRNKFWTADYKCDLNSYMDTTLPAWVRANPLYEGDTLYGRWLEILYESLDADDPLYCEISAIANYFFGETNSSQ